MVLSSYWDLFTAILLRTSRTTFGLTDKLSNCRLFLVDVFLLLISSEIVFSLRIVRWANQNCIPNWLDPNALVFRTLHFQLVHLRVGWVGWNDVDASWFWSFLSNEKFLKCNDSSLRKNMLIKHSYSDEYHGSYLVFGVKERVLVGVFYKEKETIRQNNDYNSEHLWAPLHQRCYTFKPENT